MKPNDLAWVEAQIGRVFGSRWTVVRLLGTGGSSAVFEAKHRNGKRVAIKVLRPERAGNSRHRTRFLREGYVANRVGHPGVVSIDDDGEEEDGTAYLVMELLEGESLADFARRLGGRLPWLTVAELVLELLEVLRAAHERGVVHRDLKPANLFWAPGEPLRVVDFGLARSSEASPDGATTRDDAVIGTPAFMAPEQARAANTSVGAHTDLWSVGATAFSLITGRQVYDAKSVEEQLALAATSSAPALSSLSPEVPPDVAAVFQRALSYDAADRYASAAAMRDALREALGRTVSPTGAEPESDEATFQKTLDRSTENVVVRAPGKRARLIWVAAAAVFALAALAALGASSWFRLRVRPEAHDIANSAAPVQGTSTSQEPITVAETATISSATPETAPSARQKNRAQRTPAAPSAGSSSWRMIEEPPF